ncbi:MAG: hypothetical protein N4A40_13280 [Tissierellales bacterium]|jgi:hypothetical protein|nr:hypothetical protein [Tissierellales bacterium]
MNKRGSLNLQLMIVIPFIILCFVVVYQFTMTRSTVNKMKNVVNIATNSGAYNVVKGTSLAQGVFLIDEDEAKLDVKNVLIKNFNLNSDLSPDNSSYLKTFEIKELKVINSIGNYHSDVMDRNYDVEHPSIFLVIEVEIKDIFGKKIVIDSLASSQLKSKY